MSINGGFSSFVRRVCRYRGLMILALWQAAPIGTDDRGRTRIGFGVGGGQLEYAVLGCDGEVLESQRVGYRHAAAEVEHWVSDNAKVHASGGYHWADSASANGPFGTFRISYEGESLGIGAGLAFLPDQSPGVGSTRTTEASGMLRVGSREAVHARIEVLPPAAHSFTEIFKIVIGFNQLSMTKASGSFGIGVVGVIDSDNTGAAVGELFTPLMHNVLLGVRGYVGPGHHTTQAGVTAAFKIKVR